MLYSQSLPSFQSQNVFHVCFLIVLSCPKKTSWRSWNSKLGLESLPLQNNLSRLQACAMKQLVNIMKKFPAGSLNSNKQFAQPLQTRRRFHVVMTQCRVIRLWPSSPLTRMSSFESWFDSFGLENTSKSQPPLFFFPCFFVNEYSLLSQSNFMFKVLWHQLWPVLGWDSLVACYLLLISKGTQPLLFPFSAKEPKNLKMHSVHHWWWS